MFIKYLLLLFVLDYINADYFNIHRSRYSSPCPVPKIAHGTVRVRQKSKLARFSCSYHYTLVGNRYNVCKNGYWDEPMPVCVRSGCPTLPDVSNSLNMDSHDHAWVVYFCLPGHRLLGSPVLFCDGDKWNGTVPSCVGTDTSAINTLSCDFEDPNLCGWNHDELHDFDWIRLNKKTPSSFLQTGPSYDHTLGKGQSGYYMYIESTSRLENNTARLLSPIYEERLTTNGCFSFYYHMWGRDIGGLRVYQKPDSLPLYSMLNLTDSEKEKYILFEQWGNQGDIWYGSVTTLKNFSDNFQIVIEGIRGKSFTSDIAIDDVAILQGENCTIARSIAPTPTPFIAESCSGRCDILDEGVRKGGCGCGVNCFTDEDCCSDFIELCMFMNSKQSDEVVTTTTVAHPQTEKLVADSTTSTSTSTTPSTTSTTTTTTSTTRTTTSTRANTISLGVNTTVVRNTTTSRPRTKVPVKISNTTTSSATRAKVTPRIVFTPKTAKVTTDSRYRISSTLKNHDIFDKKKQQEELEARKLLSPEKKSEGSHSGAKTATITIASICLVAFGVYFAVWVRGSRARETLARLRGTVMRDPEVRYLSADVDDD